MAEHLASIFGTEKDRVNCPFFFKIGACRYPTAPTTLQPKSPKYSATRNFVTHILFAIARKLHVYIGRDTTDGLLHSTVLLLHGALCGVQPPQSLTNVFDIYINSTLSWTFICNIHQMFNGKVTCKKPPPVLTTLS